MKAANSYIRVGQGISTTIYRFYKGGASRKVSIFHREVKPIIFRVLGRKFDFSRKI